MIQRKGELILSWIGNGLHLLYVFLVGIFFIMTQTSEFKNGMIQGFIEENHYYTSHFINCINSCRYFNWQKCKSIRNITCYYRNHWSLFKFYCWCLMVNSRYHAFST